MLHLLWFVVIEACWVRVSHASALMTQQYELACSMVQLGQCGQCEDSMDEPEREKDSNGADYTYIKSGAMPPSVWQSAVNRQKALDSLQPKPGTLQIPGPGPIWDGPLYPQEPPVYVPLWAKPFDFFNRHPLLMLVVIVSLAAMGFGGD